MGAPFLSWNRWSQEIYMWDTQWLWQVLDRQTFNSLFSSFIIIIIIIFSIFVNRDQQNLPSLFTWYLPLTQWCNVIHTCSCELVAFCKSSATACSCVFKTPLSSSTDDVNRQKSVISCHKHHSVHLLITQLTAITVTVWWTKRNFWISHLLHVTTVHLYTTSS